MVFYKAERLIFKKNNKRNFLVKKFYVKNDEEGLKKMEETRLINNYQR